VIEAALKTNSKTLGELGEKLGGTWGRITLAGSQILFAQLWLPVGVILVTQAMQAIFPNSEWWQCNINPTALFAFLGFGLAQVARNLGHAMWLAYASVSLLGVMSLCILIALMTDTSTEGDGGPGRIHTWDAIAGGSTRVDAEGNSRYAWYNIFSALGVFIYSCLPNCIVVETMAQMEHPEEMHKAAKISFAFYVLVYLLTGVVGCLYWGGDVALPMTNVMKNDIFGVTANLILVYCTLLDFVIGATTVNRFVQDLIDPDYDFAWNTKGTIKWFMYSLPASILSTLMALFIPKLESLTGILNSITGSTLQLTGIAVLLLLLKTEMVQAHRGLIVLVAVAGLFLTFVILASTFYFIANEDYRALPNETFWCDVVG